MQRLNLSSGAPWESLVGYSRLVKVGPFIRIAGTTAIEEGEVVAKGDPFGQTKFILEKIEHYLIKAGSKLSDVVATRIYVTNIEHWKDISRAHGLFFSDIRPAATMVEVSALIDPDLLVEIEVEAIVIEELGKD